MVLFFFSFFRFSFSFSWILRELCCFSQIERGSDRQVRSSATQLVGLPRQLGSLAQYQELAAWDGATSSRLDLELIYWVRLGKLSGQSGSDQVGYMLAQINFLSSWVASDGMDLRQFRFFGRVNLVRCDYFDPKVVSILGQPDLTQSIWVFSLIGPA